MNFAKRALAFLTAAFCWQMAEAKTNEIVISKPVEMKLPVPKINGEMVKFEVKEGVSETKILFKYKRQNFPPGGSETATSLTRLKGVKTLKQIYEHFNKTQNTNYTDKDFQLHSMTSTKTRSGTVYRITTYNAAPGVVSVYILPPSEGHSDAILLSPIHFLDFDWSQLDVKWK